MNARIQNSMSANKYAKIQRGITLVLAARGTMAMGEQAEKVVPLIEHLLFRLLLVSTNVQ